MIKEVETLQALVALITQEEFDSMKAMRFRMRKADKALWMDLMFYYKNRELPKEENKRYRSGAAVYSSLL